MRMIEQLANVLAKIIFNKKAGNYEEAYSNIDSAFRNMLGLELNFIDKFSAEDIISLLSISDNPSAAGVKCIIAARLLKEKAEINELSEKENPSVLTDYKKALKLYFKGFRNIKETDIDLTGYYQDIRDVVNKTGDELPPDLKSELD